MSGMEIFPLGISSAVLRRTEQRYGKKKAVRLR